jgi:phosphatidylglycerol lysyltransferase
LQKIGEEAVLDLAHFNESVKRGKYFRQINNKFNREGFTTEVLTPPHDKALIARLTSISDEWLTRPGRSERGFMMGYFSEEYLQQSSIVVARDSAGTIQGFLNQIPSYDKDEANFDLLRHAARSPGNINDYILMGFIEHLTIQHCKRLNLGLCPLAGLDDLEEKSVISRSMQFLYSNGDRFYSFSGLRRFKSKYEPEWNDRYVAYKGGVGNFVRAVNMLTRAMKVKQPKQRH